MADAPREGGGAPPAEALPAEAPPVGSRTSQLADRFERALSLSRLVVIIPVIVLLLSAVASFAYGTEVFVRTVRSLVVSPQLTSHNLGFLLLLTDLFLVGATLMIAGFGLYELSSPGSMPQTRASGCRAG